MKEATGELNMTVVTVVAIAAIGAFFYAFIWPAIKDNIDRSTKCSNAICPNTCPENGTCECTYINEDGDEDTILCTMNSERRTD